MAEPLDEEGKRRPPQGGSNLATEAAGRLEGEPPDALAMLKEHPLRDATSVGMANQVDLVEAELLEPGGDDARVPFERVARVRS